jgi:Electron transfer DM13
MKLTFCMALLLTVFGLTSCSKNQESTSNNAVSSDSFNVANAILLRTGSFSGNRNYSVTGSAKLYEYQGKRYIRLENFVSSNGPDLKVYIATTTNATQFVNIGDLKSITGTQTYLINNPPDFAQYNKVLIWCQQFSALFGSATIQ